MGIRCKLQALVFQSFFLPGWPAFQILSGCMLYNTTESYKTMNMIILARVNELSTILVVCLRKICNERISICKISICIKKKALWNSLGNFFIWLFQNIIVLMSVKTQRSITREYSRYLELQIFIEHMAFYKWIHISTIEFLSDIKFNKIIACSLIYSWQ